MEDVLEKYKIKNLDEYISTLIEVRNIAIKERNTNFCTYIKETIKSEKLEQELAELKQGKNHRNKINKLIERFEK